MRDADARSQPAWKQRLSKEPDRMTSATNAVRRPGTWSRIDLAGRASAVSLQMTDVANELLMHSGECLGWGELAAACARGEMRGHKTATSEQ